ncbi:WXG100 family type VII secretion target [Nocardia sp. alder85J]|uniref:WXG100 family type VII secretion target n=1 Tax=Nocardia sp. alder85J TaxID=2862949 RepID=UPI001CD7040E|nr:hypothetical protein [Nocardia sp. alder85J]MCX4092196.1 hypothetical protein [Nocardia sp. alder85J]
MKFNFSEVDDHSVTLGRIISNMDANSQHISSLAQELLTAFTGAGASGYESIMNQLKGDLSNYQGTLAQVHQAISTTAGSQGLMQLTDTQNGSMFLAI